MKRLFEFVINKEVVTEKPEETTNETGEKVTVHKKITELQPQKFFIRKPNRELRDEADLFYGVELADGIKKGLMTSAMLSKRYINDDGALSDSDKKRFEELRLEAREKEVIFQKLNLKGTEKTSDEEILYRKTVTELTDINTKLQEYQFVQENLFSQTAETRARNKAVLWWILHLSYKDDKETPVCGDKGYKDRIKIYDEIMESEDALLQLALKRFTFFISLWYMGRAETPEDFKGLEDIFNNSEVIPEPKTESKNEPVVEKPA